MADKPTPDYIEDQLEKLGSTIGASEVAQPIWDYVNDRLEKLGSASDMTIGCEFLEVLFAAANNKVAVTKRSEASRAVWDALMAGDKDSARALLELALHWHDMVRDTSTLGDFSGTLEAAAREHGLSPTEARIRRTNDYEWVEFWMDVGRRLERVKRSGRRHNLDSFLADLALAADAERLGVSTYEATKPLSTEAEARRRRQATNRARTTIEEWSRGTETVSVPRP